MSQTPVSVPMAIEVKEVGQVIVPDPVWQQFGVNPGDRLLIWVEQGCLIVEKAETVKLRLRQRFVALQGRNLVDELIADRRKESAREEE